MQVYIYIHIYIYIYLENNNAPCNSDRFQDVILKSWQLSTNWRVQLMQLRHQFDVDVFSLSVLNHLKYQ